MKQHDHKNPIGTDPDLSRYLAKIRRVFDVDALVQQRANTAVVSEYYTQSDWGYRIFHTTKGAVHMALNPHGAFDEDGYYGQPRIVEQQIQSPFCKILELASGKGFNTVYLAQRHPEIRFAGIDVTLVHVSQARRLAYGLPHVDFQVGNFQETPFRQDSFDITFIVESLCHATNMHKALHEVYRVLKPGGSFVVFDGFRRAGFEHLHADLRFAAKLVEIAMAVDQGWIVDEWVELVKAVGFEMLTVNDLSEAIMPNLMRLQFLARGYFKYPLFSALISHILPPYLTRNAIVGLLMPFTMKMGAQGYYCFVMRKPE